MLLLLRLTIPKYMYFFILLIVSRYCAHNSSKVWNHTRYFQSFEIAQIENIVKILILQDAWNNNLMFQILLSLTNPPTADVWHSSCQFASCSTSYNPIKLLPQHLNHRDLVTALASPDRFTDITDRHSSWLLLL